MKTKRAPDIQITVVLGDFMAGTRLGTKIIPGPANFWKWQRRSRVAFVARRCPDGWRSFSELHGTRKPLRLALSTSTEGGGE